MTLPPGTNILLKPAVVEYRRQSGYGTQVVIVTLIGPDPRILAKAEVLRACSDEQPMSLTLSEILWYIEDAKTRLGLNERGTT